MINDRNVEDLVRAAQLYGVDELNDDIQTYLEEQEVSCDLYIIALKYQLQDFIVEHEQWSFENFPDMLAAGLITKLSGITVDTTRPQS